MVAEFRAIRFLFGAITASVAVYPDSLSNPWLMVAVLPDECLLIDGLLELRYVVSCNATSLKPIPETCGNRRYRHLAEKSIHVFLCVELDQVVGALMMALG